MASLLKYESLLEFQTVANLRFPGSEDFRCLNIPRQVFKDYVYPNVSNQNRSGQKFFVLNLKLSMIVWRSKYLSNKQFKQKFSPLFLL